jgi:hypothetical protein
MNYYQIYLGSCGVQLYYKNDDYHRVDGSAMIWSYCDDRYWELNNRIVAYIERIEIK